MLNENKVVPKLRQEVKVKVDIVTSDDIKIYYTGKFQDFTARYIINVHSYEPCCGEGDFCTSAKMYRPCAQADLGQYILLLVNSLHVK